MDESEEMVRLLLGGARMLKFHCPSCSLPLFGRDNSVICVRCGIVKVVREGEEPHGGSVKAGAGGIDLGEGVRDVLLRKRKGLLAQLDVEEDPGRIVSLLDALARIDESLKGC